MMVLLPPPAPPHPAPPPRPPPPASACPHLDIEGAVGRLQLLLARDERHPGGLKVGERKGLTSIFGIGKLRNGNGGREDEPLVAPPVFLGLGRARQLSGNMWCMAWAGLTLRWGLGQPMQRACMPPKI